MPPLRPSSLHLSKSPVLRTRILLSSAIRACRSFSAHPSTRSDHPESHSSQYDPPSGWLFGVPPGEKYKKEGWENIWVYGFWGTLLMGVIGYAYKPDTSIQTWALEEARRRLEVEGILPDPDLERKQ